jgi:hypothetical protein
MQTKRKERVARLVLQWNCIADCRVYYCAFLNDETSIVVNRQDRDMESSVDKLAGLPARRAPN